ncbi:MAG: tRNA lysidine(34) synthetase TilS, partial [Lysobacterales bacterium]
MTTPLSVNHEQLSAVLHASLARAPTNGPLVVAFSGGSDSTALLHILSLCGAARTRGLRALHVDHRLAARSAEWTQHCVEVCAKLGVPLRVLRVNVRKSGDGLEAAARRARYEALSGEMLPEELLLTAHHADDQAETVLLRLLRGAGVHGAAGMREWRELAPGWLGRPWLEVPRSMIEAYVRDTAMQYITDPANADAVHDRNFLRLEVMPRLAARWPQASATLARSAQLIGGASLALIQRNRTLLAEVRSEDDSSLDCASLRSLGAFDLEEVVRAFVADADAPSPPARVLALLRAELLEAPADAIPSLMWRGFALRRFRDALYLTSPLPPVPREWSAHWDGCSSLALPAGLGVLHAEARTPLPLTVTFRRGGER